MTTEQIEKAAEQHSERWLNDSEEYFRSHNRDIYEYGFIAGVGWRIDSVWHDKEEKPEQDKFFLYENEFGEYETDCIFKAEKVNWDIYFRKLNLIRWSYILDLLPERKEETK